MSNHNFDPGYPFQIKFNTGLNRLGFYKSQLDELIKSLQKLKPNFIFSHLGASDDISEKAFTKKQIKKRMKNQRKRKRKENGWIN